MRHPKRITMIRPSNDNDPREPWITYACAAMVVTVFLLAAALIRNVLGNGNLSVSLLIGTGLATFLLALTLVCVSSTESR